MKIRLLLTLLVVLAVAGSCSLQSETTGVAEAQELKLILRFDKTTYHVDEDIVATVILENIGEESVVVNSRMAFNLPYRSSPIREITLNIITPSGKIYWPDANYSPYGLRGRFFVELVPGESIETSYHMKSIAIELTEIGIYRITANYQNLVDPIQFETDDTRIAWKGELLSNEVSLTIIP